MIYLTENNITMKIYIYPKVNTVILDSNEGLNIELSSYVLVNSGALVLCNLNNYFNDLNPVNLARDINNSRDKFSEMCLRVKHYWIMPSAEESLKLIDNESLILL